MRNGWNNPPRPPSVENRFKPRNQPYENKRQFANSQLEEPPRNELPFRNVPGISFNKDKRSAPEIRKTRNEREEPAYRHVSALDDDSRIEKVVEKILNQPITVDTADLLGLLPQLKKELVKIMAKKRVVKEVQLEEDVLEQDMLEDVHDNSLTTQNSLDIDTLPAVGVEVLNVAMGSLPAGTRILGDPVMQYLDSLTPGQVPKKIFVAKESQSLRTIYPLINGVDHVESILDGGSQIVSMSEEIVM